MHRKHFTKPPMPGQQHTAHKFQNKLHYQTKRTSNTTSRLMNSLSDATKLKDPASLFNKDTLLETLTFLLKSVRETFPAQRDNKMRLLMLYSLLFQINLAAAAMYECKPDDLHGQYETACKLLGTALVNITTHPIYEDKHNVLDMWYNVSACQYDIECKNDQNVTQHFQWTQAHKPFYGFNMSYDGNRLFESVKADSFNCGGCAPYEYNAQLVPPPGK